MTDLVVSTDPIKDNIDFVSKQVIAAHCICAVRILIIIKKSPLTFLYVSVSVGMQHGKLDSSPPHYNSHLIAVIPEN